MGKSLSAYLSVIADPRRGQGLRTDLDQILIMALLGYLCGYGGYRPLARFCKSCSSLLIEKLHLRHGIPSHVTFREVLQRIDSAHLATQFNEWANSYVNLDRNDWVSGDGKTLNSTVSDCHGSNQDFEAVVSLFAQKSGLVYALKQYRNKDKDEAEASVLRFLLEQMNGMGIVLTMDALHTQKKND